MERGFAGFHKESWVRRDGYGYDMADPQWGQRLRGSYLPIRKRNTEALSVAQNGLCDMVLAVAASVHRGLVLISRYANDAGAVSVVVLRDAAVLAVMPE